MSGRNREQFTFIHIGSNNMIARPLAFLIGCLAILGMLVGVFIAAA